jgi:hypothetical protein
MLCHSHQLSFNWGALDLQSSRFYGDGFRHNSRIHLRIMGIVGADIEMKDGKTNGPRHDLFKTCPDGAYPL